MHVLSIMQHKHVFLGHSKLTCEHCVTFSFSHPVNSSFKIQKQLNTKLIMRTQAIHNELLLTKLPEQIL